MTKEFEALKPIADKQTQTEIINALAEETGLSKKEIQSVLSGLSTLAKQHIMPNGSGEFKVPYLGVKLNRKTKPATDERTGRNPATGEQMIIAAKPARDVIKAVALKTLKEVV